MFHRLRPPAVARIASRHSRRTRQGAAMVEFAIVAPVFFMFTFACVEFARVNMLRNTAEIAAVEGARAGVIPGATAANCIAEANQELSVLGVTGQNITVVPATITDMTPSVKVNISIPLTVANGYVVTNFFLGKTITTSIELRKER